MSRSIKSLVRAVSLGLMLAAPAAAWAAADVGTARKVVNDVFRKALSKPAAEGDQLSFAETVTTGRASAVDIRLIDESTLIIGENGELTLDELVYRPAKGLVEGSIEAAKGVLRFASAGLRMDMHIRTPHATIGIRGTRFDVLADAASTEVAVHEGTVEVTSAAGSAPVSAGQVYRVEGASAGFRNAPTPAMQRAVAKMLAAVEGTPPDTAQTERTASADIGRALQRKGENTEDYLFLELAKGLVVIKMRADLAPKHVKRLKELIRAKFYDGLKFHFVRPGYVVETGDPTGTGKGGSGTPIAAEFTSTAVRRGIVGMSRQRGDPNSADSQFFIALGRAQGLDGKYTVWGQVVHGIETLDALAAGNPPKTPDTIGTLRVAADALGN